MSYDFENRIPVFSFFTGGGFLDMGVEQAGFQTVFSNENNKDFAKFYKEGMSAWSNSKREISSISSIDSISKNKLLGHFNKDLFGIIGGPPCQDFSIRGSKAGFEGLRGTNTFLFYEKIMDLQPSFFLMENVPGLVLLNKTKNAFDTILNLFRDEYFIYTSKLNVLHFGVPQNRERLFVFGIKKELAIGEEKPPFEWPTPIYPNAENNYNWGEPHGKSLDLSVLPNPPECLCTKSVLFDGKQEGTPNGDEYFEIKNKKNIKKILEGDTYRPSFKRLHRNKYSPTVCYGNNEVHLHPYLNRRLSVREALRLQGVPDSYILTTRGKLSKKFKMIGNGVPVPLAKKVALSIHNFLSDSKKTNLDGDLVKKETKPSYVQYPVKGY